MNFDRPVEELIADWWQLSTKLDQLKKDRTDDEEKELALRKYLVSCLFPILSRECLEYMTEHDTDEHRPECKCGKEGVNYFPLPKEFQLKGTVVIDRKVDEAMVKPVKEELKEKFGINGDTVFRWKPELDTKVYKALPAAARKVVDTALTIKPGSPKLELSAPKEKG